MILLTNNSVIFVEGVWIFMPRLKDENKKKKRKDILTAAKSVFLQKGYELTTIQDIANEVGITRGTMYLYFSGKDELFQELLHEFYASGFSHHERLLSVHDSVWAAIDALLVENEQFLQHLNENFYPVIFEYNTSSYRNLALRPRLQERYELALTSFTELLQQGVLRKELHPVLPLQAIARQWITFFDGLACDALHMGPDTVDVQGQLASFRKTLLILLGVKSSYR